MKYTTSMTLACVAVLSACGGGGSNPFETVDDPVDDTPFAAGAVTQNANGSFTIVQDGETVVLPASSFNLNGELAWQTGFNGGVDNANSFITDDVTAIGGVTGDGVVFSGITGTLADVPTGDATFDGRYSVNVTSGASQSGALSMTFDLAANTLNSVSGSTFEVDGDAGTDGSITGTVAFGGETADFEGGFYGDDDVVGAFNSDTIGGVFQGAK